MKKVSCIICAYNEEKRIGSVLKTVADHPWIDETIVVNDGSIDRTAEKVRTFKKVKLVDLARNQGKTKALLTGIQKSKNECLLLLDADLQNLTKDDVSDLLRPVLEGKAELSLSLRKNSLLFYKWIGLDFVTGERVFNKKILSQHLSTLKKLPRFGFEAFLNELFLKRKAVLAVVRWKNVTHARKSEKMGWWKGEWEEIKMGVDVLRTLGFKKIIRQNVLLWKRARAR